MQGKIIKGIAGFYYIYAENDEIYECKAKGIFRKDKQKPLVGDNVEIEVLDEQEKEGSVTAILPRKNSLIRPAVANVDQAFVIFAAFLVFWRSFIYSQKISLGTMFYHHTQTYLL